MIEIETISITLGEKEYQVQEASFLRSKPWKQRLFAEVKPLFAQVSEAQEIEFNTAADLVKVIPLAETLLIDAMDKLFELLIAYSPVLEDDQEYIANNATDKQILAGFQEVVKFADPFGMTQGLNRRIGRATNGTS